MSEFKLGRMILKSLLSRPVTTQYPVQPATYHEATKGHVTIDVDKCRFDGSCAVQCPTQALEVDRAGLTWAIDRFRCVQCRSCVNVCMEDALHMDNAYAPSASAKHVDVYGLSPEMLERRRAEEAEKKARAARLREEAAAKKRAAAEAAAKAKADVVPGAAAPEKHASPASGVDGAPEKPASPAPGTDGAPAGPARPASEGQA